MWKSIFGYSKEKTESDSELEITLLPPPDNEKYRLPYFVPGSFIFLSTDKIEGKLKIPLINGSSFKHEGIYAAVVGQFRVKSDESIIPFFKRKKLIIQPGEITRESVLNFGIRSLDYSVPSFYGTYVDVRYVLQVWVECGKNKMSGMTPIYLLKLDEKPQSVAPSKFDFGIQNILHIEYYLLNPIFDCGSVIIGRIYFSVIKIRIVQGFIEIRRDEELNTGIVNLKNKATVCRYELLDGVPVRGDYVPIRLFMPGVKVWPYKNSENVDFKVYYSIRLLFYDEHGKKYVKELDDKVFRLPIE